MTKGPYRRFRLELLRSILICDAFIDLSKIVPSCAACMCLWSLVLFGWKAPQLVVQPTSSEFPTQQKYSCCFTHVEFLEIYFSMHPDVATAKSRVETVGILCAIFRGQFCSVFPTRPSLGVIALITITLCAVCHKAMTYVLFYPVFRLLFGTLYPAYASYKAVKTKDVKEYVSTKKWAIGLTSYVGTRL